MSFYNGILNHDDDSSQSGQGPRGLRGRDGVGVRFTSDGDYDIQNKKLTNVKNGDADHDAMTKSQIEAYVNNKTQYLDGVNAGQVINNKAVIYSPSGSIHTNDLYLKDKNGQEVHFYNEDQDLNQCRLYVPNLKNNDSYGGRLKSSVVVTSINQTIEGKKIFHDIEVPTPIIDGHASNKAYVDNEISKISDASDNSNYVKKSGDTMTGSLIVPQRSYPIQGSLNQVISYETQREIFLSKREESPMQTNLNMNGHSIDNLPLPVSSDQACSKGYLDTELNHKVNISDLNDYLKIDGSRAMTGNLNMANNRITNLPSPYFSHEAATKDYVTTVMNHLPSLFLDRQGKSSMLGNLNMNNHLIQNVKDPVKTNDAVNVAYLNKHSIQSAHPQKNILDYVMKDIDQTSSEYGIEIDKIDDYNDSFHTYNKKVIYLKLIKDGNNYRSRIGYNIFKLIDKTKNKYYTACIEWLTKDNNAWSKMEIFNNITSGSIISSQTRKFEDGKGLYYTRSIVQFEVMAISTAPLYLLSTIHIDGVNPTYPNKFSEVYNIIYGIDGKHTAISPNVYDFHDTYQIKNDKMIMNVDLDINGKSINNIGNISMNGHISIYGLVDQFKNFTSSNVLLEFRNIHIVFIKLYMTPKTINKSDTIKILYPIGNEEKYQFRFPPRGLYTQITINRYFNRIESIKLKNASNIAFQLGYALLY